MTMIRVKVLYLDSPDTKAVPLSEYHPQNPTSFGILVEAGIGPTNDKGEEIFSFVVCTPLWMQGQMETNSYRWGKGYLFVSKYDYALVERAIQKLCMQATAETWKEVANILSRYTNWGFENYQPGAL